VGRSFLSGVIKDLVSAVAIVGIIALIAYTLAGTWPVMVAVESGSMMPNIHIGDIVFIQCPSRVEIMTSQVGREMGHRTFGDHGDVIVFRPNGDPYVTPIIHRAMYWVDVGDRMPNGEVAQHAGFITRGDSNQDYDQPHLSGPVKPEWIVGVAWERLPYIGYVRLVFDVSAGRYNIVCPTDAIPPSGFSL